MKYVTIILAAAVILRVTATAQAPSPSVEQPTSSVAAPPSAQPPPPANYIIQPEDVLQLDVWGEPDLSRQTMPVTPEGKVNVPYVGEMQAAGLTQQQLADNIAKALIDAEILKSPRVVVSIVSLHKRTVRVLGQVGRPGEYDFRDGDTVMEAVASAGSFTPSAYLEGTTLTRRDGTVIYLDLRKLFYKGDMTQNIRLEKGDTINIPEDVVNRFYVLGEVLRPGLFQLQPSTTVLSAISIAGGPTPRGTLKAVAVVRNTPKGPQRLTLNLNKLVEKAETQQDMPLLPGDVVYVPESTMPDWNKISAVLNSVLSATYITRRF